MLSRPGLIAGAALILASRRRQVAPEIVVVAAGSAAALAAIDTVYVAKRRISPVYLLDAVAEIALVAGWAQLWWRGSSDSTATSRQR